jgi:G3E family GTPase
VHDSSPDLLPVTLLTGFLGSGKTSLLNRWLSAGPPNGLVNTAVVINEVGDVGLDHLFASATLTETEENIVLLDSGCVCCTLRVDLVHCLRELWFKRERGEIPRFDRLLIETSGLADPAPILHTLINEPLLSASFRLDGVVTLVDAVHASKQMSRHLECVKQIAMADLLIFTKTDLASAAALQSLKTKVNRLNSTALTLISPNGAVHASEVVNLGLYDVTQKSTDVRRWLGLEQAQPLAGRFSGHLGGHLGGHLSGHPNQTSSSAADVHKDIEHFAIHFTKPVLWQDFEEAFNTLALVAGDNVLRIKGVLNVQGVNCPLAVHAVQHQLYPAVALNGWPAEWLIRDAGARVSVLVIIVRRLAPAYVKSFFDRFLA